MAIADRLENIARTIERHRDRITDLQDRAMYYDLQNRRMERESQDRQALNRLRNVQALREEAAYESEMDKLAKQKYMEAQPFNAPMQKTDDIPEAVWLADRVQDTNKTLSSSIGYGVHYDPSTGFIHRDDTGQKLTNKEVAPHMQTVMGMMTLNSSPRRFYETRAQANDPRAEQYKAVLAKYNKNPVKFLEAELARKQQYLNRMMPMIKDKPELVKMAEAGVNQTAKDLEAARSAMAKQEKRRYQERQKREERKFKKSLEEMKWKRKQEYTPKEKDQLWLDLEDKYNDEYPANEITGKRADDAPNKEKWKQRRFRRMTGDFYNLPEYMDGNWREAPDGKFYRFDKKTGKFEMMEGSKPPKSEKSPKTEKPKRSEGTQKKEKKTKTLLERMRQKEPEPYFDIGEEVRKRIKSATEPLPEEELEKLMKLQKRFMGK